MDRIIARFIDWLAVDEKSFIDAYVQLCIPKLLSLFIRLEMIAWNPLEVKYLFLSYIFTNYTNNFLGIFSHVIYIIIKRFK